MLDNLYLTYKCIICCYFSSGLKMPNTFKNIQWKSILKKCDQLFFYFRIWQLTHATLSSKLLGLVEGLVKPVGGGQVGLFLNHVLVILIYLLISTWLSHSLCHQVELPVVESLQVVQSLLITAGGDDDNLAQIFFLWI